MAERHFVPLGGPFDIALTGTRLVEAGAGTGKTWTIAALVLRLLLEREIDIGRILVVTYTRAATGELRGRIRARLVEALAAFMAGTAHEPYLSDLLARLEGRRERSIARLKLAIESFDEAAIHTIHGFCQRALGEAAFEAGCDFERELVTDPQEMLDAVARDAWRRLMSTASPAWAGWLITRCGGPAGLLKPIRAWLGRADVALFAPAADLAAAESAFAGAFAAARPLWHVHATEILDRITRAKLHKGSYKPEKLEAVALALGVFFTRADALPPLPAAAALFGRVKLVEKTAKGETPPDHPFFDAMQVLLEADTALESAFDAATRRLAHDFMLQARDDLAARKRRSGQQAYDDLLADLANALRGPAGSALADSLRRRYQAALVDEFQDTNPQQLEIFHGIFGASEWPLLFVGDPKQAIYGFQGADVFAYLTARSHADAGYALLENRRSDAPLLVALNALFERPQPFLIDALPFDRAVPARMERCAFRIEDGAPACQLWTLRKPAEARSLTKEHAQQRIAAAVAVDIARLLALAAEGRASYDGRALCGGDIAVLVRNRGQGECVRAALAQRGIASVALGGGSVWESGEAEEIERLLLAIAAPTRAGLVRAALATVLMGADAAQLAAWNKDEAGWSASLDRFYDDVQLMRERGFMALWRRLLRREHVVARVLARPDGERRLTNYRHLAELLQAAEQAQGLDAAGLARHLAQRRVSPANEDDPLRLESDAQLVHIVTIHASKGLQYPVVYCPFLWDARQADAKSWPVLAHVDGEPRAALDFGSPRIDALRRQADLENAAEELRLAYVALTRAQHRCILAWGKVNQSERSPLAWLLFGPRDEVSAGSDPRARLFEKFAVRDEDMLLVEVDEWAARLDGPLAVLPLPDDGVAAVAATGSVPRRTAREFRGFIPAPWRVASFSALAARLADEAPEADRDAVAAPIAIAPAPTFSSIHDFPRGTRAGSCLHALLERIDFQMPAAVGPLAAAVLEEFGYAADWRPALERMVADVLAAPLDPQGLRLADVPRHERLVELEFVFPLSAAAQQAGYMKGFIDLVFRHRGRWYIVDWKSNRLGDDSEDYAQPQLEEAMHQHRYDLQQRIYAAALRRALALREPQLDWEAGFGGVFYLFLRGMQPGSAHGIHFARPTLDEIAEFMP